MPGDICNHHCNKECTKKSECEAIQCDICFVWAHASCEDSTKDQFKLFSDSVFQNLSQILHIVVN